ncbi:MAG: L,D-transpeptidase family protein [Cardiobacteriaceae bacterium]|nr:L,D-transpeptidase family protein [Cardiobacteriaceae bacterium]
MKQGLFKALCVSVLAFSGLARAEVFPLPPQNETVVGYTDIYIARKDEAFKDIARRFGVGYDALVYANRDKTTGNRVDDLSVGNEGEQIILPKRFILPDAPRQGIVVNLPEMRLYYYPPSGKTVEVYAIGVGRDGWETPLGLQKIREKRANPTWTPPASIHQERKQNCITGENPDHCNPLPSIVPAGPDNPLGLFAMRLSNPSYLIHGTNKPDGVGMRVSHGCIRMYPEGIEELFSKVGVDTPVNIINQPVKLGHYGDAWYLEVHQWFDHENGVVARGYDTETLQRLADQLVMSKLGERAEEVSRAKVQQVVLEAMGLPANVGGLE